VSKIVITGHDNFTSSVRPDKWFKMQSKVYIFHNNKPLTNDKVITEIQNINAKLFTMPDTLRNLSLYVPF